jgi:hypothetical protein
VIVIVVLGDHDPLGSNELLFQMMGYGLLLFLSEGDDLVQGLACSSHGGNESSLLLMRGSCGGLLLIDGEVGGAAQHGRQHGGG